MRVLFSGSGSSSRVYSWWQPCWLDSPSSAGERRAASATSRARVRSLSAPLSSLTPSVIRAYRSNPRKACRWLIRAYKFKQHHRGGRSPACRTGRIAAPWRLAWTYRLCTQCPVQPRRQTRCRGRPGRNGSTLGSGDGTRGYDSLRLPSPVNSASFNRDGTLVVTADDGWRNTSLSMVDQRRDCNASKWAKAGVPRALLSVRTGRSW